MAKIYIAGPMTGMPHHNFPAFFGAETKLQSMGFEVINPARMDLEMDGFNGDGNPPLTRIQYMERDLPHVKECDMLVVLPGWEKSLGAKCEIEHYFKTHPNITHGVRELVDAINGPNLMPITPSQILIRQEQAQEHIVAERGEERVVNPTTGGEKGSKLARFDLLPWDCLTLVAEHYGRGAKKYQDRNWEKGYDLSLSAAALQRHFAACWQGEDLDPETGSHHMAAVVFHALAWLKHYLHPDKYQQFDNRPK